MDTPIESQSRGFPIVTAAATLAVLFLFLGVTVWVYRSPNYLDGPKPAPTLDPVAKLKESKAKNDAVLAGSGARMSVSAATKELLPKLKSEQDHLPFPAPEPPAPVAEPKKK
ncbi:MAG: hypothetical protein U0792_05640 [Gemmataceae bacterium]